MDANKTLKNKLSMGAYSLDGRMDASDDYRTSENSLELQSRIDVKGIREAIARVEAEARATVAAENRAQTEARARSLAEERAQTDVEATALAQRKVDLEEGAIISGRARLEADRQSSAASEARIAANGREVQELQINRLLDLIHPLSGEKDP